MLKNLDNEDQSEVKQMNQHPHFFSGTFFRLSKSIFSSLISQLELGLQPCRKSIEKRNREVCGSSKELNHSWRKFPHEHTHSLTHANTHTHSLSHTHTCSNTHAITQWACNHTQIYSRSLSHGRNSLPQMQQELLKIFLKIKWANGSVNWAEINGQFTLRCMHGSYSLFKLHLTGLMAESAA